MVKGYKITDVGRRRLIGVACSSLNELIEKGSKKLQISDVLEVHLQDGTVVNDEEYFQTLPNQTVLILRRSGEDVMTGADVIYNVLRCANKDILETGLKTKQFLEDNIRENVEILSRILNETRSQKSAGDDTFNRLIKLSSRKDDPDWFKDLDTSAKTKEEFMTKRCRGRIQSYFYDTRDTIRKNSFYRNNVLGKLYLERVFQEFSSLLKSHEYFGWYFNRQEIRDKALCDENGTFDCQGLWNAESCNYNSSSSYEHRINPYSSREERILFGMWNLDHNIERTRTVVPALIDASKMCLAKENCHFRINSKYFSDLLFTKNNLKIVHLVCHDKGHHKTAKCDPEQYILCEERDAVDSGNNNGSENKITFIKIPTEEPNIYKKRRVNFSEGVISSGIAVE